MTLQEKLIMVLYKTSNANYASELLEKVADDYCIGFAEWYSSKNEYFEYGKTIKELLIMYKKEKEL
jgi:hypothetical protein